MSWDKKGERGPYFYLSVRKGDKVVKQYLGKGERAEATAREVEGRRKAIQAERDARLREQAGVAAADQQLRF